MWISKLYATFGKLENQTLELSEGINVVYGDNESGKSTWSSFIRVMFYGISSREQRKTGFIPDKEKYLPWKGLPMYGKMELSFLGEDMTIERTAGKNNVLSSESAKFNKSGKDAPLGEALVGVSRNVYERTAYIKQAGIEVSGDKECEKRILAIASSGDEEVSAKEVSDRLKKRHRASSKAASALGKEIEETTKALSEGSESEREISRLEESLAAVSDEIKKTERALAIAKAESEKNRVGYIEGIKRAVETASEKVISFSNYPTEHTLDLFRTKKEELSLEKSKKEALDTSVGELGKEISRIEAQISENTAFSGSSCDMAKANAENDIERAERANVKKEKPVWAIILALVSFAALCTGLLLRILPLVIVGVAALMAAIFLVSRPKKSDDSVLSSIKEKYGAAESAIIREKLSAYLALLSEKEEKSEKLTELSMSKREAELSVSKTEEGIYELLSGYEISERDIRLAEGLLREKAEARKVAEDELSNARAKFEAVSRTKSEEALQIEYTEEEIPSASAEELSERALLLSERYRKLELALVNLRAELRGFDREKMASLLSEKEDEKKKTEEEALALELAIETLSDAEYELKSRFSPEIEKRASAIFKELTGGSFSFVKIRDNEFNMEVGRGVAEAMRPSLMLSQGTVDELYFSLRLALFEAIAQSESAPPIILDDALVNFDDTRMERALDLLYEMSEKNQVIIFSCHSREAEYLKKKPRANIVKL